VFIQNEAKITSRVYTVSSEQEFILASCCSSPIWGEIHFKR